MGLKIILSNTSTVLRIIMDYISTVLRIIIGQHEHGVEYHHGQQEHSAKVHHEQYEHGAGANGSMAEEILTMRISLPPWSEVWVLEGCENSYTRGRGGEKERGRE